MLRPQARPSGKMTPSNGRAKSGPKANNVEEDDDLEQGLGRAHNKDFLGLEDKSSAEEDDDEDKDQNPVFNLKDSDDDDGSDNLDEDQLTGLEAKLVKQVKIMKPKAGLEEEEDEEEEEEDKEPTAWGNSKQLYYSADTVDFEIQSGDDEAPAEEEAGVFRLQRKSAASLWPEEQDDEEESDGREDTLEKGFERKEERSSKLATKQSKIMALEGVQKDSNALSKEDKMGVVMRPQMCELHNLKVKATQLDDEQLNGPGLDERKQKRMLSNRESARRSRLRKQQHLDELRAQVGHLRAENTDMMARYSIASQRYSRITGENVVLRAHAADLSRKLHRVHHELATQHPNGLRPLSIQTVDHFASDLSPFLQPIV